MIRKLIGGALLALAFVVPAGAGAAPLDRLEKFGQSLNLLPAQKAQFDAAVVATKRAVVLGAIGAAQLKAKAEAEFAKPRPDLAALAQAKDAAEAALRPVARAAREEWLALYAMLSDEQVATVTAFLKEKMEQRDAIRQFVLRLMLGGS